MAGLNTCPGHPRPSSLAYGGRLCIYSGERSKRHLVRRSYERPCSKNLRTSQRIVAGFTKKYSVKRLVYFEHYEEIQAAIQREHNMKHWSRKWKVRLILANNPAWNDLYDSIV
jgi:predicted GIY-YIG superfamily endonuclease